MTTQSRSLTWWRCPAASCAVIVSPAAWALSWASCRSMHTTSGATARAGVMEARRSLTSVELRYLYVGSSDVDEDLPTWLALPGARLRWRFRRFGADVAAVDLGAPPVVLVADHRPAGSVLPIFAVAD